MPADHPQTPMIRNKERVEVVFNEVPGLGTESHTMPTQDYPTANFTQVTLTLFHYDHFSV